MKSMKCMDILKVMMLQTITLICMLQLEIKISVTRRIIRISSNIVIEQ